MRDIALALDVIEHVYEPELMVAELRRVLRPGGAAIVTTDRDGIVLGDLDQRLKSVPVVRWLGRQVRRRVLRRGSGPRRDGWQPDRHDTPLCTHTHEYVHADLVALFERGGFRLDRLDSYPHRLRISKWGQLVQAVARGPLRRYKWEFVAIRFTRG